MKSREYYTEFAEKLPADAVILTAGIGGAADDIKMFMAEQQAKEAVRKAFEDKMGVNDDQLSTFLTLAALPNITGTDDYGERADIAQQFIDAMRTLPPSMFSENSAVSPNLKLTNVSSDNMIMPTGTAPCKTVCPAHIAVQGYIRLASQGKYLEALELIRKENPFPAVCGRICPHDCENECTRGEFDEPIAIDEIKKFIADQELNAENRFIPKKLQNYYDKKVAVIGSGPAGLSCAYYLAIYGYDVTVFEKEEKLGGMFASQSPKA